MNRLKKGFIISTSFFISVAFATVPMLCSNKDVTLAKSFESNVTKNNVIALLEKYDKDGAFIVKDTVKAGDDISVWINSGTDVESVLATVVHEQCHSFSFEHAGFNSETIYIGNEKSINVKYTDVYKTQIMAQYIPAKLRTFRYNNYVSTSAGNLSSNVNGAYGLLNEFTAYYTGMNNTVNMFNHYKMLDVTPTTWIRYAQNGASDRLAYAEFKYYILRYLDYAKKNYPSVYTGIINNANFVKAYVTVEKNFSNANKLFMNNLNEASKLLKNNGYNSYIEDGYFWAGNSGAGLYLPDYNMLINEIKKYKAIEDLLKGKVAVKKLATPAIASISNETNGVKLNWKKVSGAVNYKIFRKNSAGKWVTLGTTTKTSFVDKKAVAGKLNTYTIRCVSKDGRSNLSDYNKNGRSITYRKAPIINKLVNEKNGVKIMWGKVSGATNYKVYRKTSNGWVTLGTTTKTSFVDKNVISSNKYTYTVRCVSKDGKNNTSAYNTSGRTITRIGQPELIAASIDENVVTITWKKVKGASRYRVFKLNDYGNWSVIGDSTSTSFVDYIKIDDLNSYIEGYYTVRCVSKDGSNYVSSYDDKGIMAQ